MSIKPVILNLVLISLLAPMKGALAEVKPDNTLGKQNSVVQNKIINKIDSQLITWLTDKRLI